MSADSVLMIKRAVEYNPVTCRQGILERLFSFCFDGFVYNQIWEDPIVDREALELDSESRVLTISSGGCNILNYLVGEPFSIDAVDLNRYHIYFTHLKIQALKYLPGYNEFFDFFGCANKFVNLKHYYQYIQPHLDEDVREFWENSARFQGPRIGYFTKNLYNHGTMGFFIRFVHFLAKCFSLNPQELLLAKDAKEREEIFEKDYAPFFDILPVKILGRMPFMFYSLGIPPQQFKAMKQECNGQLNTLYCERIKRLACQFPIEENYFAWQAFSRSYDNENRKAVPDYLKEEYYPVIQNNLSKIKLHLCSMTQYLNKLPEDSLNRFVLLDSMDWMNEKDIFELWSEIYRTGEPGSRIIFRTASYESPLEKALPGCLREKFVYHENRSHELFKKDRSAIYGGFHLYSIKDMKNQAAK